jgi:hypothetical protein
MITIYPAEINLKDPEIRALAHAYKMGFANDLPEVANPAFAALISKGIVPTIGAESPLAGTVILTPMKYLKHNE